MAQQLWDTTCHTRMTEPLDACSPSPEAASLSDKVDKSDEKMDTSETSGSSEKTSPIPNDVDAPAATETSEPVKTSNITTETVTAPNSTTPSANTTTTITNANLVKKTAETASERALSNARTESSTSISSFQGEDLDLELASNYHTETVDFPDNPLQLKLMNQTVMLQEASLDEELDQQDDEVFRAVLSPSSDGVKLKKVIHLATSTEEFRNGTISSNEISPRVLSDGSWHTHSSPDASTPGSEKDSSVPVKVGDDTERNSSQCSTACADFDLSTDYYRSGHDAKDYFEAKQEIRQLCPTSTPCLLNNVEPLCFDVGSTELLNLNIVPQNSIDLSSDDARVDPNIVNKIRSCLDNARVRDVYTLFERLQEKLTDAEVERMLQNSSYYSEFFDQDEQQYVFEAVRALRYDHNYSGAEMHLKFKCAHDGPPITNCDASAHAPRRTKIQVNRNVLDDSIVERFERELEISAVFEGNRSLRRSAKAGRCRLPSSSCNEGVSLDDTRLSVLGICHGDTEAYFEESVKGAAPQASKRKIAAPLGLADMNLSGNSGQDVDKEIDDSERKQPVVESCSKSRTPLHPVESGSQCANDLYVPDRGDLDFCILATSSRSLHHKELPETPANSSVMGERPNTLSTSGKKKIKIKVNPDILDTTDDQDDKSLSSLSNKSDDDVMTPGGDIATLGDMAILDDMATPDDIDTPEDLEDSTMSPDPIPEVSAEEERDDERRWRTCVIGGVQRKIDMKVIEPYKKVLSHGGYYGLKRSAIIVFSACYLPDHSRKDYDYVMDNLFLYVLTTLDQLVAEDYVLVYLHGAMDRNNMPTFGWLKRCYQMIDRRLRKNLKGLYLVHPTFWLKTIVLMTRPFISTKFSRKLQFVNTLQELSDLVPIDQMSIPDRVKQLEFELMIREKKRHFKAHKSNVLNTSGRSERSTASQEHSQIDHDAAYRVANSECPTFTTGWV